METFISVSKLKSYLGQLTDLKAGILSEIVIKRGMEAEELEQIIKSALWNEEKREQMEKEHDIEELKAQEAGNL